jgi:hypothetical protein
MSRNRGHRFSDQDTRNPKTLERIARPGSVVERAAERGPAYCFFGGGFGPCRGGSETI